jgi:hypothetical protein
MFRLSTIRTDNAAFQDGDDGAAEVARILRDIADRIENGSREGSARDINGNNVGGWSLDSDED